jgi:hypothetical protein
MNPSYCRFQIAGDELKRLVCFQSPKSRPAMVGDLTHHVGELEELVALIDCGAVKLLA